MKNSRFFYLLPALVLGIGLFQACTNLEVEATDSVFTPITGNTFAGNATDLLASAYNDMNTFADQAGIYSLTEHVSDEMIPPTRGTDWGDNGVWRTLHAHTWDATHQYISNSWNLLNGRVFKCNQVLASTSPAPTVEEAAEAKFLRAFYMFHVMDFWGKVPFRNVGEGVDVNPRVLSRAEAFDFIENDLNEALPNLPTLAPGGDASKASKAAANTLLAKLYLNKAVYKSDNPAGPYTFDPADMAKVIQHSDAVITNGFTPDPDFFHIFKADATSEIILTANGNGGSPSNRTHMTLHYDNNPSGWNGFTTLADFYGKFEDGDQRKGRDGAKDGTPFQGVGYGFLLGPQFKDDGTPVINSRTGTPLVFTADVPLSGANSAQGIRVMKYHQGEFGKYIFFRLGDVITMKAEAQLRSGGDALSTINALRAVRAPSLPALGSIDLAGMLDERGRELYWEGWRRNDQVRFGTFTSQWSYKTNTDSYRVLYPIPQQALDSNPNLRQNDGY
ncbi:MAG: RagB/SusD family nutrient uptake outer membrane protein [Saprospiraceae bacterium]|nr:RagB/SusD family nutrient uptake outer membrane protein [Saprospiraceae bacterium]